MNRKLKIGLYVFVILIICIVAFGIYYVNDYYHAEDSVSKYLNGTGNVSVIHTGNGLFLNGSGENDALIFYPGAKVEYTAYLPLLMSLSERGVDCFVVEMPFNLAFLGENSADEIIGNGSFNYSHWFIGGHSLGGVVASSYAHNHFGVVDGLILLAAYPSSDVSNLSVLSIYGSKDNVLSMENYAKAKVYLPDNFTEFVISGGNHGQFGDYGIQSGDGVASISKDDQISLTVGEILSFISGFSV